ncbi:MAG: hypothetical protein IT228_14185 [Flavobacteriales bacterium]|nr:hypothetical protein [Flavobacteriales bacterium]NUQ13905.1 hypothetical protein [Flavobacteriales bacterium]
MRRPPSFHARALLPTLLLTLALAACCEPRTQEARTQEAGPVNRMNLRAASDCGLADMGERSIVYNRDGLQDVRNAFLNHFKLDSGKTEIKETRHVLAMRSLRDLVARIDTTGTQVDAVRFDHGLSGGAYRPVVRFLHQDRGTAEFRTIDTTCYWITGHTLDTLDAATALAWKKAYADSVWASPHEAEWVRVKEGSDGHDIPTAEWFRYTEHIIRLWRDNGGADSLHLVINCISENVCYSSLGFVEGPKPEYIHLLALNMRRTANGEDLLHSNSLSAASLKDVAVDLGTVCPPRCK